jgi:hypothetical protein
VSGRDEVVVNAFVLIRVLRTENSAVHRVLAASTHLVHLLNFGGLPSRPGEFHPEPLTEPAVTVSRRPARAAVRGSHLSSKYENSFYCQLTQPRLGCPLPSLHGHYGRFITNTEWSAPARSIGTFCLAFFCLSIFPSHLRAGSQVPHRSLNESHASYTPDAAWPVDRFLPTDPGIRSRPRF